MQNYRIYQTIKQSILTFRYPCKIVVILCLLFSHSSLYAETLIPLTVQKGTNLISITRLFCTSEYHWKEIAKINNLKSPYLISPGEVLYAPIELLKVEKLSAKVASVIGGVFILQDGKKLKQVKKGDFIYPGQTLVTEDDGFTHLVFPDNKYTRVSSGSKFTLTYLVRLIDSSMKAEFFLEKGRITHAVKKQLEVNETFSTRTPVSVTGVRGTEFRLKLSENNVNIVETLKGVVRVEGDKGTLSLKKGEGTKVVKGMKPEVPKMLPKAPAALVLSEVYKLLPIKIDVPAESNVSQYRLRVTTDVEGYKTILEQVGMPGSFFTLLSLSDGNYFGFLTAIDSDGFESLPAAPFTFEVRTVPGAPLFVSLHDGKTLFQTTVESKWLQVEDGDRYHLQLSKDRDFKTTEIDVVQDEASYVFKDLEPGTYYFRVQSIASDEFHSLYSLVDTWKIKKSPSMGKLEGSNKDGLNLSWASMGQGIVYDLQVSSNKDFTNPLINQKALEQPKFSYNDNMDPGTYYVRVRGVLDDGQESPWTPAQKLKIEPPAFSFWDGGILALFLGLILI